MKRIHFEATKGRAVMKYDGQICYQRQYLEIYQDGTIYFSYCSDVGNNTVSESVFNGRVLRFSTGYDDCMTQKLRKQIYNECKDLFKTIVNGFSEEWSDYRSCYIGVLTDEANAAAEKLGLFLMNYEAY